MTERRESKEINENNTNAHKIITTTQQQSKYLRELYQTTNYITANIASQWRLEAGQEILSNGGTHEVRC